MIGPSHAQNAHAHSLDTHADLVEPALTLDRSRACTRRYVVNLGRLFPPDLPLPGPMPFDPQLMAQLMGGQGGVPDMFDVLRGGVAPPRPNPARPPPPAENPWAHLDGDGGAGDDDDDIYG